jgi:hypothetical protein
MSHTTMSPCGACVPSGPGVAAAAVPRALYPSSSLSSDYEVLQYPQTLGAGSASPSADQLRALKALPAPLARLMSQGSRRSLRGLRTRQPGAKTVGQVVQKYYDTMGMNKPVPRNGFHLEQTIRVELQLTLPTFLTTSVTVPQAPTFLASISSFPGSAGLLACFDQYRFDQLEVWVEPMHARDSDYRSLATAIDLDDAASAASMQDVADRIGALAGYGATGRYHKWKPHMAVAVYSGAFTSFANEPANWIDSGSPNVQHYGLKAYADATGSAIVYSLTARAVVSFRSPVI